jgi:transposase
MGYLTMSQKEAPRPGLVRAAEQGSITNAQGALAAKLSVRQFRRLRAVFRDQGAKGLAHGNRGQPSPRRRSDEERQRIVNLMMEKYAGFNDSHLTEKLRGVEKILLSRELVRRIRQEAGLPAQRKRRAPKHRRRREREAREGALVLIDGSTHDWLEGRGPAFTLVGAIDDATGKILALVVRVHEDLHGYLAMVGMVLGPYGKPLTFYGDCFGALIRNDDHWTLEEQLAGRQTPTQFGQLLEELGIAFIAAHSPQAKGRIERLWETLQDRLISEIRLLGLTSSAQVEAYLPQFIVEFNARFAVPARERDSAWRAAPPQLERLLSCRYSRKVARDNTASIPGRWVQLPPRAHGRSWQGSVVEVRECLDGSALVLHQGELVVRQAPPATPFTLVYRQGGHGRRRCPENFTPVPVPPPPPPPKPAPRNRRGQITNIRPPAPGHPWRRGYKPQPLAPA